MQSFLPLPIAGLQTMRSWPKLRYLMVSLLLVAAFDFSRVHAAAAAVLARRQTLPHCPVGDCEPPHSAEGKYPQAGIFVTMPNASGMGYFHEGFSYHYPINNLEAICQTTPEWMRASAIMTPSTFYNNIPVWGKNCRYTQTVENFNGAGDNEVIGSLDCPGWDLATCFKNHADAVSCAASSMALLIYCHWE